MTEFHEFYMRRCLQLAALGRGFVSPNPMVGAVIVHGGRIIGESFHRRYGEAHAEVNAVSAVRDAGLLREATLYVNLEPCSHYGKTPPCAEMIVHKGIPRVVIGHVDPYEEVSGGGIKILQDAGVDVVCGVLERECKELNRRFLTFVEKRRPYVILKWAQSADGFIDRTRSVGDGRRPVRISSDFTKTIVHKHRAEEAAIMIGKRTLMLDEPRLDVRYWDGDNPVRFIADSRLTLKEQLQDMYEQGLQSLIVEGGARLINSFIEQRLWDEADIETAFVCLGEGVRAPRPEGTVMSVMRCEGSFITRLRL
ncbi:MAG: bifunctional diaminohydroxyphosphoribosylaminopyrimidine deaminase/5-amino-6-(5-phosphoribosylamino)uracil reductase RibD [Dysgonamonadaceae bacterium]|jgi:diaminohydroxyphosphoribosylaminopyrimidine deaminase/5-amino-6-(5-phosphoribosylamino)uracil reductase|nr:bifunctional diaminohydroxyphosphoribosylaminopyrimidine deaminase/5-amino-6-(5-phosphoribosylamino)uracil reductase RibD [Dysgonamonadaceae bacterium]